MFSGEESREFFERKEVAVKKLYEASGARLSPWATTKAILPPLIAMMIPILPIFAYIRYTGKYHSFDLSTQIIAGAGVIVLCIWYALSLWYLGVLPFLRGRPKVYDIMEDHVRMIYRDGTTLAVDFSEIERMRYCDAQSRKARTFGQKLIDPFGRLMQYDRLRFKDWFREVVLNVLPPYSFGFGSGKAEVHLRLYAGYRGMRFLLPWWNTPFRSKDLNLVPNDAREFYQQLVFAFNKWKKKKA